MLSSLWTKNTQNPECLQRTLLHLQGQAFCVKLPYFVSDKIHGTLCFRAQALACVLKVILVQREWDAARLFGIV